MAAAAVPSSVSAGIVVVGASLSAYSAAMDSGHPTPGNCCCCTLTPALAPPPLLLLVSVLTLGTLALLSPNSFNMDALRSCRRNAPAAAEPVATAAPPRPPALLLPLPPSPRPAE